MKITYKGNEIEAILTEDEDIYFIHPMTGQNCELFEQVFQGWSYQTKEENDEVKEMLEIFRINNEDIFLHLFDELDVNLEKYI